MAKILHHPGHDHLLEPRDLRSSHESVAIPPNCELCRRKISADAYACRECESYYFHRVCAEVPPRIDQHPLHPIHPLTLVHCQPSFGCYACCEFSDFGCSSFRCETCDFDLDLCCALSTLSDQGGSQGGKPSERIDLPIHPHPLTSFSTRHDFVGEADCEICQTDVEEEGEGYMCLRRWCEFLIHKECIRDLNYADGTKAPQIYHNHRLTTFVRKDTGSSRCADCRSNAPGEFIGCERCGVFIHRDCIQGPEDLHYPPHRGHTLVLFIDHPNLHKLQCQSCSGFLEGELGYHCTSCELLVHVGCGQQVLGYCEKGMRVEIELPWHKHPLFLCHRTKSVSDSCFHCSKKLVGPAYACKAHGCEFLLHNECAEFKSRMNHPLHQRHPLTLHRVGDGPLSRCAACCEIIVGFCFSCEDCEFYLHVECSTCVPSRKHYLHEHELLRLDEAPSLECNRCGTITDSPLFRCVPCNFNLHEKCMELPRTVKDNTHFHLLTLRETYMEDDSGEYYCDLCEKRRDHRLGVYVCEQCPARWVFHIECILPELQKVYAKKVQTSAIVNLADQIARKAKMVRASEEMLEQMKQELNEMMKRKHEEVRATEESIEKMKQEMDDLTKEYAAQNSDEENHYLNNE